MRPISRALDPTLHSALYRLQDRYGVVHAPGRLEQLAGQLD
jgi:hypothetical protein